MSLLSAREATVDDYPSYARLYLELGKSAPVADRDMWASELVSRTIFLEQGGEVVAHAVSNLYQRSGYVVELVVDPRARRRGLGRALLGALAARFRRAGCSTWALDVKPDNVAAITLYESAGFRAVRRSTSVRLSWASVEGLPSDAREVTSRVIDPAEDEALEAAFDLSRGQLAVLRTRRGRTQVRLVDVAEPSQIKVGVGIFDPAWPGAFPFRVVRPTLAAAMFSAVRGYAPSGSAVVNAVVDGDGDLLRMLQQAGAEVLVETVHMQGPLPAAQGSGAIDHPTRR